MIMGSVLMTLKAGDLSLGCNRVYVRFLTNYTLLWSPCTHGVILVRVMMSFLFFLYFWKEY